MATLQGKVIWITGASTGIGEALAYELSSRGAKLILSARRAKELERVKGNCQASTQADIRILPFDLADSNTLPLIAEAAIQLFGRLDILVNNAGIRHRGLILDTPDDVDRKIMEVNFFAVVTLTKNILPHFIRLNGGHFVNISSVTGKFGTPYRSGYAASKHALHGYFDALRAEHYRDNINVTMICPGFVNTAPSEAQTQNPIRSRSKFKGISPEACARRIASAIARQSEEVYIGGSEIAGVYLKRFVPSIFSRVIRRISVQ